MLTTLPPNITRITTQAALYSAGVRLLSFQEVADEAEAAKCAGGRDAFLLKSNILPLYYLIYPIVIVTERTNNADNQVHDGKANRQLPKPRM